MITASFLASWTLVFTTVKGRDYVFRDCYNMEIDSHSLSLIPFKSLQALVVSVLGPANATAISCLVPKVQELNKHKIHFINNRYVSIIDKYSRATGLRPGPAVYVSSTKHCAS